MPVLFDLDGTLLDTAPDFAFSLNKLRKQKNISPLSVEEIRPIISLGSSALIRHSFGEDKNSSEHETLLAEFLKLYQENICQFTQPFPGIMALLSFLEQNKIPWGVVTNKPGHLTETLLTQLSLKQRAACVISGDTTPYLKPHPASLLYASECLGISPEHCLYIGDAKCDIEAGKAAGMTTLAALFGYISDIEAAKQWGASDYVHTVAELHNWVEKWIK